jgi:hypothetical protein
MSIHDEDRWMKKKTKSNELYQIQVLTFNIMCLIPEPLHMNEKHYRMSKIPDYICTLESSIGKVLDVIIFTECVLSDKNSSFRENMKKIGWLHWSTPLINNQLYPSLLEGGVYIVSRWPILLEDQHIFIHTDGNDSLAAKGIIYTKIHHIPTDTNINVLGFHGQAWNTPITRSIRLKQAKEINKFVQRLSIPMEEPVLLGGDANIERYTEKKQLKKFLQYSSFLLPSLPSLPSSQQMYTIDKRNGWVGSDDPTQYKSLLWPNGCEDIYRATQHCVCCPDQMMDYILYHSCHKLPISTFMKVMDEKVKPYCVQISQKHEHAWMEYLSDHHPLYTEFTFSSTSTISKLDHGSSCSKCKDGCTCSKLDHGTSCSSDSSSTNDKKYNERKKQRLKRNAMLSIKDERNKWLNNNQRQLVAVVVIILFFILYTLYYFNL